MEECEEDIGAKGGRHKREWHQRKGPGGRYSVDDVALYVLARSSEQSTVVGIQLTTLPLGHNLPLKMSIRPSVMFVLGVPRRPNYWNPDRSRPPTL